jgi:hypothetical protein
MDRRTCCAAAIALCSCLAGCSSNGHYSQTLSIVFNPMFSGYDGAHTYQIPATIENASVNGIANVKWSASDKSYVDLAPADDGVGVMVTTKKAGTVTLIATTDDAQGKVKLTIAAYTPDQWAAGMTRYTSGTVVMGRPGRDGPPAGGYVACTSCHGDGAKSLAIQHTPEQTGGFTDEQLRGIFLNGQLPDSDQNPLDINPMKFASFHKWQTASDDETNGLIAYLRSLTPEAQGAIDFGGRGGHRPDGGYPHGDGGFHHGDGGSGGDAGADGGM